MYDEIAHKLAGCLDELYTWGAYMHWEHIKYCSEDRCYSRSSREGYQCLLDRLEEQDTWRRAAAAASPPPPLEALPAELTEAEVSCEGWIAATTILCVALALVAAAWAASQLYK